MANEPDIKLLFGVEGGASIDQGSGKQIFDDLKKIVESINGKDVLKVKVGLDDSSAKDLKDQIKGIMSGVDAGAEVKVTGLDKTTKALESVASAAKKVGQAAKESSGDALAKGTKEYHDALTKINTLLIQLRNNQRNWSAASGGKSSADMAEIGAQIAALQSLEGKLAKGELTAEDFADEMSRVRSLATDAAESINALGESHKAVRILAEDTRAYNEALSRSYSLLAQIYTNQNSWTAAANGTSSSSYESFATAANDVTDLIASLRTGSVSADEFGDKYSEINARVKEASAVIKEAAENHAVESVHVERLTSGTQRYNDALARSYSLLAQIATNQNSWTAAIGGKSDASYQSFSTSADELNDLITALRSGGMAADDFADRYSLINASVKEASAEIRIAGENHIAQSDKVAILARDTQEYNDALSKTYSLLGQVSSNYASWTAASSGSSSVAYQSLGASISDIDDLISSVKEGAISAKDFAEEYSRINVAVKESSAEIKRAGENHAKDTKEVSNLTRGTREYYSALTRINTLLVQLSKNRERWSAASEGDGKSSIESIIDQEQALKSLELRLYSGSISAEDFGREFSRIQSIISYATEHIRSIGEDHSAIEVLTKDTKEYNDALTKSYTLLGQVATHLKSWSASKTGESAPSYISLSKSYSDLEMLTSFLEEGVVDANTFALTFADIKRNVAEASTAIKVAGENMKAVESPDVIERLARVNAELKEIAVQNSTLTSQYKKITGGGPIDGVSASSVDALKVKYQEMLRQTELLKVNRKTATDADIAGVRQLQDEVQRLVFDINRQAEAVKKTSSVDKEEKKEQMASLREVIALYEQIDKYLLKNSRAEGTAQYESLRKIRDELYSVKQAGEAAEGGLTGLSKADLRSKVGEVRNLESGLRDAGREGNTLAKSIAAAYQKFGGWMLVTQSLTKVIGGLKQMVENIKQIDLAMTELKKVTNETDATYDQFLRNATVRAAHLGSTVSDVISATAEFSKLGHTIEDATKLADAALVYKNVGDGIDDISVASQSIISTMQAFGYNANDAMLIVDKFNHIANRYAVDSAGLGESLMRSASAMASANNTLDETIALTTAANTILQDPQVVGTTMKTLSMYLRAAKTEAEEAGESTDGMASSVSELRDEILALTGGAVDIMLDEDSFKSSYQILKELSQIWGELTDVSQANILEMIGGRSLPRCTVMCI